MGHPVRTGIIWARPLYHQQLDIKTLHTHRFDFLYIDSKHRPNVKTVCKRPVSTFSVPVFLWPDVEIKFIYWLLGHLY